VSAASGVASNAIALATSSGGASVERCDESLGSLIGRLRTGSVPTRGNGVDGDAVIGVVQSESPRQADELLQPLRRLLERDPDRVVAVARHADDVVDWTATQVADQVCAVAKGLVASGVERGKVGRSSKVSWAGGKNFVRGCQIAGQCTGVSNATLRPPHGSHCHGAAPTGPCRSLTTWRGA